MRARDDDAASQTLKRYLRGTHRVCEPEETLNRLLPLLPAFGITRLADVTRLDRVGIPVYQAVRPNSWSLSVSQGKGLTSVAAKVSAAMESIEAWHAERLPPPECVATVAELADELGYDVFQLRHFKHSLLNPRMRIEWLVARRMDGSGETLVPRGYVSLDWRVQRRWAPPVFSASSNGLASGNSVAEAALHGLCEVVERDAIARLRARPPSERVVVAVETVQTPDAALLLERLRSARMGIELFDATGPTGIPAFLALIGSEDHPHTFGGAGSHPDAQVALCRAVTEAAQSRLTAISGVRDDLPIRPASRFAGELAPPRRVTAPPARRQVSFAEMQSLATDDVASDLQEVVARVEATAGTPPLILDLTRADIGVPVVKVIAPGLRFDPESSSRTRERGQDP